MARLDFRDNITCWLRPETWPNVSGTIPSTGWEDSSGADRDFLNVGGAASTVIHNALNGYAVVDLDGVAGALSYAGNLSDLIAATAGAVFIVFKVKSFGTNNSPIPTNDAVWAGDSASSAGVYLRSGTPDVVAFNDDGVPDNRSTTIAAGVWYVHMWRHKGGRLVGLVDDALIYTDIASGSTSAVAVDVFIGKNHEATPKFADIQIAEAIFFTGAVADQDCATVVNYLLAKFGSRGDAHGQAINVGSRGLWDLREPQMLVTVPELPPAALDVDAGDLIALVHPEIPHPAGLGAGAKNWERLALMVREARPNLDTLAVKLVGERVRQHVFYAAAKAVAVPGQGLTVSALTPGPILARRAIPSTVAFGDGVAWVQRAADGLIDLVKNDDLKIEPNGVLCEIDAEQYVQDSVLFTGGPEFTLTQPTGGSVAYETAPAAGLQLFSSDVTTRLMKFTRGTALTGIAAAPVSALINTAVDGSDFAMLQIDVAGVMTGFVYRLREGGGSLRYWNNATKTWDASAVDSALSNPNASGIGQYVSEPISLLDTSGVAYSLEIRQNTGVGSAGDIARFFYCGFVQDSPSGPTKSRLRWPCSRVVLNVTTPGSGNMGQDFGPIWLNPSGGRNFNAARGAILMRVRHRFNTADVLNVNATAVTFTLLHAYYDSNNEWWLHYFRDSAGAVAEYRFDVKAAGTVYRAVKTHTVLRDAEVNVWARYTSAADGELDKPARTLTVGVDGVAGTDVQAAAYPTETTQGFLGVGARAETDVMAHNNMALCGWWSNVEILAECPTDAELNAWRF